MTENKGDLISREALKKEIKDVFDLAIHNGDIMLMSKSGIVARILAYIDLAPTVETICPYLSDDEVKQPCIQAPCERPKESELVKAYCKGFDTGVETARQKGETSVCQNPKGNCFTCKLFEVCDAKTKPADMRGAE